MGTIQVCFALAVYSALCLQTASGDGLDCQVDRASSRTGGVIPRVRLTAVSEDDDIVAELRITNDGTKPYRLWRWNWPGGGGQVVSSRLFTVYREKLRLGFEGWIADHGSPEEEDYLSVPPGSTCTATVSLGAYYDLQPKGRYSIRFGVNNKRFDGRRPDRLESNVVTVEKK